jgi:hypothetical protein
MYSMTTTLPYTLPSGKSAIITVASKKIWDGGMIANVTAAVDGVAAEQLNCCKPAGLPAWAVSAIGKLPLTAEAHAAVQAACDAINAAHAEHNAAARAHVAELEAVSASTRKIERAMACGE